MPFAPADMLGLPGVSLAAAARRQAGNYLLSFDYPDFNPFMANAESEDARRRYYAGYLNRGSARNLEILDEVVSLRRELAALYELPSYAHFVLRRRMAETPEAVERFLAEVKTAVDEAERRDLDELRALKATRARQSAGDVVVHRWDLSFLSERLREERYSVDQESLRRYFPPGPTLA
jgi:thimet oligopeptidase